MRYAALLDWGARIGLLMLVLGFALYVLGWHRSRMVPLEQLPGLWSQPAASYLERNRHPHRLGLARAGAQGRPAQPGGHRAAGRLFAAAACSASAWLYLKQRDWPMATICVLVVAVIVLAASGVLTAGH